VSHEQSETEERDGLWYNIYGALTKMAGQVLPQLFPFERPSYPSEPEASLAADIRSRLIDPNTDQPYPDWSSRYEQARRDALAGQERKTLLGRRR
jgi:hypothetical protein